MSPRGRSPWQSAESRGHTPVLAREVVDMLRPQAEGVYVDATLGLGGHTQAILSSVSNATVIGIDTDPSAIAEAKRHVEPGENTLRLFHARFADLHDVLRAAGVERVDGILADLGVSSYALDTPERGFTFQQDGPLDMRFDPDTHHFTAREIVMTWTERELADLFREAGDEPFAPRIARVLVQRRHQQPLETTTQLAELVRSAVPARAKYGRIHPATRVFQALRMAVNAEMTQLETFLPQATRALNQAGRVAVIAFHSGEDRRVKQHFRREAAEGTGTVLTRKPLTPTAEEVRTNPRARSAKMRVFESNASI